MIEIDTDIKDKNIKIFITKKDNDELFAEYVRSIESRDPDSFVISETGISDISSIVSLSDEGKSIMDIISDYLSDVKEEDVGIKNILSKLYEESILGE